MSARPGPSGVSLPDGASGSSFLHALLRHAVEAFPAALAAADVPADPSVFKNTFADVVPRFEACRAAAPERVAIARAIRLHAADRLRFVDERGARPLPEVLAGPAEPLRLTRQPTRGPGRLVPAVPDHGTTHAGAALRAWLARGEDARLLTAEAADAVRRLLARAEADGGALSLAGVRFALMGAGAELSPARVLLAAGAEVLWLDLRPPPPGLTQADDLGGALYVPEGGANLLAQPGAIAATIRAFASDGPVHVGMYAYAGGESQELRLTASMNAIARSLPPEAVASVAMLISPTTAMVASPEDDRVAEERLRTASAWKRALARAGVLRPGRVPSGGRHVCRSIVPLQGASYQAAQYVGKVLAAETIAVHGVTLEAAEHPTTVSANVAPITATKSLSHPLFQAGFLGAPMWGITIAEPPMTRTLAALMMISDVTDPAAPCAASRPWPTPADRARALFTEAAHGGVYAQPYALYGGIQVAAVQGIAKRPSLLAGLLR